MPITWDELNDIAPTPSRSATHWTDRITSSR
jgi:hypothetical protein